MNKTVLLTGISIIVILAMMLCIMFIRVLIFNPTSQSTEGKPLQPTENFNKEINRFCKGLQFQTISTPNYEEMDSAEFDRFTSFLESEYPLLYSKLEQYEINRYGLIFHWLGNNPSLKPVLFLSHYDVVPVSNNDSLQKWISPPFSGSIVNDTIYGRGALDMKSTLFSLLDASERLIEKGFAPQRDIYFAFGHDEEVGSQYGAKKIAQHFEEKSLSFDAIFDEGGAISFTTTINQPIALIGVAEKGKSTLRIRAKGIGGHASIPTPSNPAVVIAKAITILEERQFTPILIKPVYELMSTISPYMSFVNRFVLANHPLFESVLINKMLQHPATAAMVRTTTAATMTKASNASNVLPTEAEAVISYRILPGNTVADVQKHAENICNAIDIDIDIETIDSNEPSPISPNNTQGYMRLTETIHKVYPNAIISAYISIGATDSRQYKHLSPNVYRFTPVLVSENELQSIHNVNERISVDNYKRMIYFYEQLISGYD